ncbi:PREDICTED: agamous-like MADS-box protein AGL80 [Fragaria vesca subsp. vesca]|uniref:agamous-like MADS-box protein AGL80 n=1 Tax=Fragaria vesca subsp. vesca TaxID=101020 RepID=UPI0002C2E073|nr:PREDICTED: agamous-like MADS-box protein AGL80 [Fragaria vesca subsp. vesca]
MARKKVKIAYIINNSARKATFNKRKKSMMKKLGELSILCGVDACAIVYSPFDSQVEVWSSQSMVENVLEKFKNLPVIEKSRKMLSQETYLIRMIFKENEQLKKVRRKNRENEMKAVLFQSLTTGLPQFQNLKLMDMDVLGRLINNKLNDVDNKGKTLGEKVTGNQNQDQ